MRPAGSTDGEGEDRTTAMGPGAEFDLIRTLLDGVQHPGPAVLLGPGDDAAVLEAGRIVVSTDLTVEDVHFRRSWISLEEAGFRAVTAAASDLAAMAARPVGVLVSLAIEVEEAAIAMAELGSGIRSALADLGTDLVGGDLTASPGPIVLDVTVIGEASEPMTRRGAEVGDELWVTGVLGGSAGAVRAWTAGAEPGSGLRAAFARPAARIPEARWLAERGEIRAMIDLSDGLLGDSGHLAAASGVRVDIESDLVPAHPELAPGEASDIALSGGEDYELCVVAAPGTMDAICGPFTQRFGVPLTRVGSIQEGEGVSIEMGGPERGPHTSGGFDHFTPAEAPC